MLQPILVRPAEARALPADRRRAALAGRPAGRPADHPRHGAHVGRLSALEQALVENLHREDLNPLEEAAAYQQLIDDFGLTHEQVATRVGKSRATVTNTLRLFQLPPSIQRLVADGRLTAGHARALLGRPTGLPGGAGPPGASAEGWSVRAVEDAVRSAATIDASGDRRATSPPEPLAPPRSARARGAALRPPRHPGAGDDGCQTGRVVIEFATLEDLERIYRLIAEPVDPECGQ